MAASVLKGDDQFFESDQFKAKRKKHSKSSANFKMAKFILQIQYTVNHNTSKSTRVNATAYMEMLVKSWIVSVT